MVGIADQVVQPLGEFGPPIFAVVARVFRFRRALVHPLAELLVRQLGAADAQDVKRRIGTADARQVIQGWNQLAFRQIAGATEDDQQAGTCLGKRRRHNLKRLGLYCRAHFVPPADSGDFAESPAQSVWTKPPARAIGALIGVGPKEIALRLRQILRQLRAAIAVKVRQ